MSRPLDVIASNPPRLSPAEAAEIAARHWAIEASATPQVSERDQNFRLRAAGGAQYLLKIANASEDPAVGDFQILALRHIADSARLTPPVPRVVATRAGEDRLFLSHAGSRHLVRMVTWVPGEPLEGRMPSAALAHDLGRSLARLGLALADFDHPGPSQPLLWDLRHAPALRDVLAHVPDASTRALLAEVLERFAADTLPALMAQRAQVIHNDLNPANVLVEAQRPERVAGIIDFGDMQRAPLVIDLAVAAAYLRPAADGDPLALIETFLSGYHALRPLEPAEIDLLVDLVCARLATTIAILAWRAAERGGGDAYLEQAAASEDSAEPFLRRLLGLPRAAARRRLRQVCAAATAHADRDEGAG